MDVIVVSAIFILTVVASLVFGISIIPALLIGLMLFTVAGMRRGHSLKALLLMLRDGVKDAFPVIWVLLLLGVLTAAWRASGTMALFICGIVDVITPRLFLFSAFVFTAAVTYIVGSGFGVIGTLGVIFMALARGAGVSELITAGAVMSGAYFGDRTAPIAPCINLTTRLTGTDLYKNVRLMFKTAALPMAVTGAAYLILSVFNPISAVDTGAVSALREGFSMGWWSAIPVALLLILPLLRVRVSHAMPASIIAAAALALISEKMPPLELIKCCLVGYSSGSASINVLLAGGGLVSMLNMSCIILVSCAFAGIFKGTNMLDGIKRSIGKLEGRIGRFPALLITSWVMCAMFCSVTIVIALNCQLWRDIYAAHGASDEELAMDIQNGTLMIAGFVPWAISCSVPFAMMGVDARILPYSFLLFLLPLIYGLRKRRLFHKSTASPENN